MNHINFSNLDWDAVKDESFKLADEVGNRARTEISTALHKSRTNLPDYFWDHQVEASMDVPDQIKELCQQYVLNYHEDAAFKLAPTSGNDEIQAILTDGLRRVSEHSVIRTKMAASIVRLISPLTMEGKPESINYPSGYPSGFAIKSILVSVEERELNWALSVFEDLLSDERSIDDEILLNLVTLAWPFTQEMTQVDEYFKTQAQLLFQILSKESELTQIYINNTLQTRKKLGEL